jgi:uncharacterized repeat protein (TIGR01451 family)/fimbrial isopeptide formation D2 family protein
VISPITPFFEPVIGDLNLNTTAARTIQRVSGAVSVPDTDPPTAPGEPSPSEPPVLSVIKTATPDPAAPGDTITYNVTVSNNGAGDATGVTLTDDLNTDILTLDGGSVTTSVGTATASGNSITVNIGDLGSGANASISYQATVKDPLPAGVVSVTNTATASSNEEDGTHSGEATTDLDAGPVLEIAKSTSNVYASPGDVLLYTVIIENIGNQEDTNVIFNDALPANTILINGSVNTTQGSVTSGNASGADTVVVDVGTVGSGDQVEITYQVTLAGSEMFATGQNEVTNEGVVTSDTFTGGLSDTATTWVNVGPHLDASKRGILYQDIDRDGTIGPGDVLYFEIVFTNVGNQNATNVRVNDVLDRNLTLVERSVEANQGSVVSSEGSLDVTVDTLPPGEEISVSFQATVDDITFDVSEVTNQATATCNELDTTFETNTVTIPVTSDPIIIDKPLREGDLIVEGTALAGEVLTLEVLRTTMPALETTVTAEGTFSFDLSNTGVTLSQGDYVLVKGYGTQDIARVEAALDPNEPYMEAENANCASDTVTLEGGNWETTNPTNKKNDVKIIVFCDGAAWHGTNAADYEWTGSFTYPDIPFTPECPSSEPHTITARVYYKYGTNSEQALTPEVQLDLPVICPIEPEQPPDIQVESLALVGSISPAVVDPGFGTYEPITVTVVLTNTSTTNVTSLFEVDLFVDPDPDTFLFEQASVDHVGIQVLEGSSNVTFDMYVEEGFSDTEPHTLTVKADTFEQILEIEEEKNVMSLSATASYTNPAPTPTPTPTPTLELGAIQGETWLIIKDELMPQSGVEVYAETVVTDTHNITRTVTYGPVYSDNLGRYTLTDLPQGTYAVTGKYELLEANESGTMERVVYQNTVEVEVTAGMTTTGVYLILEP